MHLLDGIAPSPELDKVKELLTVAAVKTNKLAPSSRSLILEGGLTAAAPARREAAMTAPTTGVPTRTTVRPAARNKRPPTTSATSSIRRTPVPASTPFVRSAIPSTTVPRPSLTISGSTSTHPGSSPPALTSMMGRPIPTCGCAATPQPSRPPVAAIRPRSSTSPWLWRLHPSYGSKLSLTAPLDVGMP